MAIIKNKVIRIMLLSLICVHGAAESSPAETSFHLDETDECNPQCDDCLCGDFCEGNEGSEECKSCIQENVDECTDCVTCIIDSMNGNYEHLTNIVQKSAPSPDECDTECDDCSCEQYCEDKSAPECKQCVAQHSDTCGDCFFCLFQEDSAQAHTKSLRSAECDRECDDCMCGEHCEEKEGSAECKQCVNDHSAQCTDCMDCIALSMEGSLFHLRKIRRSFLRTKCSTPDCMRKLNHEHVATVDETGITGVDGSAEELQKVTLRYLLQNPGSFSKLVV